MSVRVRILFVHAMMFHSHCRQVAAEDLETQGINVHHLPQAEAAEVLEQGEYDILIAELSVGRSGFNEVLAAGEDIPHRLGLSSEIPGEFSTFEAEVKERFLDYTAIPDSYNYGGAMLHIAAAAGYTVESRAKKEVLINGIYHPAAPDLFSTPEAYFSWRRTTCSSEERVTGILFYHGQLVEESLDEIDALIRACDDSGLCPVAVFTPGAESEEEVPGWYRIFREIPKVGCLVNCLAGRLMKNQQDTALLTALDIPIWQGLRSHSQTPEQWFDDPMGLPAMSAVFSQTYPEMFGAVRPTMLAGVHELPPNGDGHGAMRRYQPVKERIHCLVRRLSAHFHLREKENSEKRLTIVLHNNPYKGVEATVGMAVGLDTFKSLGRLLRALQISGYDIGEIPTDGEAILSLIMEKKAVTEFRWTTVDEIIGKGGALYMMGREEYRSWFDRLDSGAKQRLDTDWGEFPGQGMVTRQDGKEVLVVTGLRYGNVQVVSQPKRGCYGAKCNGEVCRILHDPELAPPHHWLATYKYIQDTSDAVVHFGTEGSLEYLPGKQNGMSGACFSEISLGDLPNFYVYVMDAVGEGMVAKRRGQAMLVDHLGPVLSPSSMDEDTLGLDQLLDQYLQAASAGEEDRTLILRNQLLPILESLELGDAGGEREFDRMIDLARRRIAGMRRSLTPESLHVLGQAPTMSEKGRLLATMLRRAPAGLLSLDDLAAELGSEGQPFDRVAHHCEALINNGEKTTGNHGTLGKYCFEVHERLEETPREIEVLLRGLEGGYIPPGPAGSLTSGRSELLPSGRNFYGKDTFLLPTQAAWEVGCGIADQLLAKYYRDEARFPESIGISIWSSDAFKSDGELLCQIIFLMGIKPVWDARGKTVGLSPLPLEQLELELDGQRIRRPRVDMVIETSGIMRDMVPHFCDLMDKAVVMAADLEEPDEWNCIRKHTLEQLEELRNATDEELSAYDMHRLATYRVFSSPPGVYGHGVGLALDASAWSTDRELTEIHVHHGGYAYGEGGAAIACRDMFARRLAGIELACIQQGSEEYDILDCGCYAVSQGSMAVAARVLGQHDARLYWTDASDMHEVCDMEEQLMRSATTRLLNTSWIETMKEHGYQGAMAVSARVNNLYKWGATTRRVPNRLFDEVVRVYLLNPENRKWLMEENPYALEEITRRLLEASSRDIWKADEELLEAVRDAALEIEGEMEERMGEVVEEFQGGSVDVLGREDVDKWNHTWSVD